MTRINNTNDMIKAAGGKNNIQYVWAVSNKLYMKVKDSRKMNYLAVLNTKDVNAMRHLTGDVYMIELKKMAYDMAEDMTRNLDGSRRQLRTA